MSYPNNVRTAVGLAALALAFGCGEKTPARVYQAPKESAMPDKVAPAIRPASTADAEPRWVVPANWTRLADQQMRFATFQIDRDDPKLNVVVYAFGPESGQLLANVNRWEQQIGTTPSKPDELPNVVTHLKSNGLEIDSVDLKGPPVAGQGDAQRMLAAIIPANGRIWFLKLVGSATKVAEHQAEYNKFMKSISFPAKESSDPGPTPSTGEFKLKSYTAPSGWTLDPEPRQMRVATFKVQDGGEQGEVIISTIAGTQAGTPEANVNRWRAQVGLPPIGDMSTLVQARVMVGDAEGIQLDFAGAEKRLLVAQAIKGQSTWYVKLTGPVKLMAAQAKAFDAFLKSIQFEAAPE